MSLNVDAKHNKDIGNITILNICVEWVSRAFLVCIVILKYGIPFFP